jgi:hypothetical protein
MDAGAGADFGNLPPRREGGVRGRAAGSHAALASVEEEHSRLVLLLVVLGSSDVGARVAAPFVEEQLCEVAQLLLVRSSSEVRLGADSCSRGEARATSCCSASRRSRSGGAPTDAQARRSRAARAPHALRRRARASRAAPPLRLRRSRGDRRGGSRVLGAARPPRGRRRRRRVRPDPGAGGLREGR